MIQIQVRPVDDERPILVNNTGILVWQGSTTLLDRAQLGMFSTASVRFGYGFIVKFAITQVPLMSTHFRSQ